MTAGSTLDPLRPLDHPPRRPVARRVTTGALALLLVAALTGVLGDRTAQASASDDGWTTTVTYAASARPGLDVPFRIAVTRQGGFDGPVDVAIDRAYLEIFESQRFFPEPSGETGDARTVVLTFDPPAGSDTLVVSYDAYVQPASQVGRAGWVGVVEADGRVVAVAQFRTVLLP